MKKSKGQAVDLLYINKNTKKKSTGQNKTKNPQKKNKDKTKQNAKNEIINLDNEIIIGLTPKKAEKEKKTTKRKPNNTKKIKNKKTKQNAARTTKKRLNNREAQEIKKKNTNKKRNFKALKWVTIIILLIGAIVLFMMSSIFNIRQIVVINNSKVSSEEIIELSKLRINTNMFRIMNGTIRDNIKTNAYIDNVNIKRNINGTITLDIQERKSAYMLKRENDYAYIDNQGYILEISQDSLKVPIITGFSTSNEEIKAGNRLTVDDLNKLSDVNKIIEASKNSGLEDIITEIDISNSMGYKVLISKENKLINIGDIKNINIKLQMAEKILSSEKGKKGEIYFQEDGKKAVFKEKV